MSSRGLLVACPSLSTFSLFCRDGFTKHSALANRDNHSLKSVTLTGDGQSSLYSAHLMNRPGASFRSSCPMSVR
uniref:Putative secreted protein n=1 Tax=Anopheles darlingi TaxID=43151 RepID=A0A2M4DBA0_ANODA